MSSKFIIIPLIVRYESRNQNRLHHSSEIFEVQSINMNEMERKSSKNNLWQNMITIQEEKTMKKSD